MYYQLILLGAPGSGKGTQANNLIKECGYKHLSTGDLLRAEMASGSELGQRVKAVVDAGKLVDDDLVLELLSANCDLEAGHGIFDGFPRNLDQAKALDEKVLRDAKSKAIYFDIDLDLLKDRLVNRRTCKGCGEIYNLLFKKPVEEEKCDKCGSTDLQQRKDDNEETVKTRLGVFKETVDPILDFYESQGRLVRVDAAGKADAVFNSLRSVIEY